MSGKAPKKFLATRRFYLGDRSTGISEEIQKGDLLDWDGDAVAVFKAQRKFRPEPDSFGAAIRKGWLMPFERVDFKSGSTDEGWDDDPLAT